MSAPREIINHETISARIAEVGKRISSDYAGKEVVLVGILKGAAVFLADLMRVLDVRVRFELVNVTREAAPRGEVIELAYATNVHLEGAHALILKDICHSGVTENYLLTHLAQQRPASLEVATVIDKPVLRRVALEPKYVLFDDVPAGRLVGYGLEFEGQWGNLPGICLLDEV
jgi:hypoxanthine phosphoribosyltransferase